jgi:dipeptidyl-peptidase 4
MFGGRLLTVTITNAMPRRLKLFSRRRAGWAGEKLGGANEMRYKPGMQRSLAIVFVSALSLSVSFAQEFPKAQGLSLERLYSFPLVNGRSPSAPSMSPDGKYIVFGWNQTGERRLDLWIMDYPSGTKRRLIEAASVEELPRQDDTRTEEQKSDAKKYDGGIAGVTWAPDSKSFLFSYKGRTFECEPNGKFRPVFDGNGGMFNMAFSPDGRYLSYLSDNNLFRMERKTGRIKQLTFISKPGTSLDGYQWSPNSQQLIVSWSDSTKTGSTQMMDLSKDRAQVVPIRRMWHGERSVDAQHGLISAEGGIIRWITEIPRYHWMESVSWSPDSRFVALGWNAEDFQTYNISVVSALPANVTAIPKDDKDKTVKGAPIFSEKAPKNYIPDFRSVGWSRDGKRLMFTTDIRDGKFINRSLMSMTPSGRDIQPVYSESHDIAAWMRPKNSDRLIFVTQKNSSLTSEITIQEPDGKRKSYGVVENGMAAPKNFDDSGLPLVSEDGKMIATMASTRTLNSELYAVEPREARLTESQTPEFKQVKWAELRTISFKAPDGQTVHGVMYMPANFDPNKKYPAFISSMYANSGKLAWNGYFENYAAMELGMVVVQLDFRASWGQGGEFNSGYYKSMGVIDSDEAVACKDYLVSLGFVNPNRVGVWGWSYGGYLTCMIQLTKPGVFDTGVAVASVTDWKAYNEWYTRRRLGMQADDPEVYKKTSPIFHAAGLKDNLFLVHGMLDDNVLWADSVRLSQRLIENGKYFDMMGYPRDDHSIGREESRPHVFATIMRYLYVKLTRP